MSIHIGWIIAYVVIGLITIFFIVMYFRSTVVMVRPIDCLTRTGLYGVTPATTGYVYTICGPNNNSACTFEVDTLQDAISRCDTDPERCRAFIYTEKFGRMSYIDWNQAYLPGNSQTNLYQRRTKV